MDPIRKAKAFADDVEQALGKNHICTAVYGPPIVGNYMEGRSKIPVFIAVNNFDSETIQQLNDIFHRWKTEGIDNPTVVELTDLEGMSDSVPDELVEVTMNYRIVQGNDILRVLPKMDYEHARAQAELAVRRYLLLLRSQVLDSLGHTEKLEAYLKSLAFYCQISMQLYYRVKEEKFASPDELLEKFYDDFPGAKSDFEILSNYCYGDGSKLSKEPLDLIASTLNTIIQPIVKKIDELGD